MRGLPFADSGPGRVSGLETEWGRCHGPPLPWCTPSQAPGPAKPGEGKLYLQVEFRMSQEPDIRTTGEEPPVQKIAEAGAPLSRQYLCGLGGHGVLARLSSPAAGALVWKGVSFLLWVVRSSGPRLLEPGFISQDSNSGLLDVQPSGPEFQTHTEAAAAAPRPSAAHTGLNPETRMVSGLRKGPGWEKGW